MESESDVPPTSVLFSIDIVPVFEARGPIPPKAITILIAMQTGPLRPYLYKRSPTFSLFLCFAVGVLPRYPLTRLEVTDQVQIDAADQRIPDQNHMAIAQTHFTLLNVLQVVQGTGREVQL